MRLYKKKHYCYQKFLFEVETDDINLDKLYCNYKDVYPYQEPENLFDEARIERAIDIKELDTKVTTLSDMETLLTKLKHVSLLYIRDTYKYGNNTIVNDFRRLTLKGYIWYFRKAGIDCLIMRD